MRVYVEDWRRGRDTRKRERTLFTEERITYKKTRESMRFYSSLNNKKTSKHPSNNREGKNDFIQRQTTYICGQQKKKSYTKCSLAAEKCSKKTLSVLKIP